MYAVIESGGKQYRVELGSEIQVDRLDVQPGDSITLERVLLVADDDQATIGRPFVDGAVVNADVVDQARGDKLIVFKYRPKARRRVKKGFRASLTTLRISDIAMGGASAAKEAAKDERKRKQAEQEAEKAAAQQAAADQALAAKLAAQEATAKQEATAETAPPKRSRATKATAAKVSAEPETAATDEAPAADAGAVETETAATEGAPTAEAAVEPETTAEPETGADAEPTSSDKDG